MPTPSSPEFDSSASGNPSSSGQSATGSTPSSIGYDLNPQLEIPSTSVQQPTRPPTSSIEYVPINPPSETASTSGQPTPIRPPLSSIECDPNNPPESPSSQNEQVTVKDNFRWYERVNIQLPIWRQHFWDFRLEICFAIFLAVLVIVTIGLAVKYVDWKILILGIASAISMACFSFIWLWIDEGPPFLSDEKGSAVKPSYLLPQVLDAADYDIASESEIKERRREQKIWATTEAYVNS